MPYSSSLLEAHGRRADTHIAGGRIEAADETVNLPSRVSAYTLGYQLSAIYYLLAGAACSIGSPA